MMISFGLWAIAQAIFSRLFMPPEKLFGYILCLSLSPTKASASSALLLSSDPLSPYNPAKMNILIGGQILIYRDLLRNHADLLLRELSKLHQILAQDMDLSLGHGA